MSNIINWIHALYERVKSDLEDMICSILLRKSNFWCKRKTRIGTPKFNNLKVGVTV